MGSNSTAAEPRLHRGSRAVAHPAAALFRRAGEGIRAVPFTETGERHRRREELSPEAGHLTKASQLQGSIAIFARNLLVQDWLAFVSFLISRVVRSHYLDPSCLVRTGLPFYRVEESPYCRAATQDMGSPTL